MGLKTVNWDRVTALAEAKIGADLSPKESVRLGALINSAAQYIYDESRYQPRFLVLEPRTASGGYIQPTEDSYNVFGAGAGEANGLYVEDLDSITQPYKKLNSNGDVTHYISAGVLGGYSIARQSDTTTLYSVASDPGDPIPESGWEVVDGEDPAPIVQALSEIDEIISYWDGARWVGANPAEVYGYPDQNGFRLTTNFTGTVYVAYKKVMPDEYGDGAQGTTEDFPAEWLNYCAYSAAREWNGSQRNQDAYNPISVRDVDKREAQVLIKANRQGAFNTIANIWTTRYAQDKSIASGSQYRGVTY